MRELGGSLRLHLPLGKIVILSLWLSLLYPYAHGGWADDPFEVDPENVGNEKIWAEGATINIYENVGNEEFPLLKLLLTDAHEIKFKFDVNENFALSKIDDKNWYLNVRKAFDFENIPSNDLPYIILLEITNPENPEKADLDIFVQVHDENDNSPSVGTRIPPQIPPIKELQDPDEEPIVTITASDLDVLDDGKLEFTFEEKEGDGNSGLFILDDDGTTCKVFLIEQLNYATRTSHQLTIKISDNRDPFNYVTELVTVVVEDVPNIPPQFTVPPIINKIREEQETETTIKIATARDGDSGLNWEIEYAIEDDELDLFKIDPQNGEIKIKNRIDAEADELAAMTYSFTVVAREKYDKTEFPNLTPQDTETKHDVTFAIEDINDQSPRICTSQGEDKKSCKEEQLYSFTINENHTGLIPLIDGISGDSIIIRVVDLDSTTLYNQFEWEFEDDVDDVIKRAFSLSPKRGMGEMEFGITVLDAQAIDFENGKWQDGDGNSVERSFTIVFTDMNDTNHQARAHFQVKVEDVNDNRPIFELPEGQTQYEFAVCENTDNTNTALVHMTVPPSSPYPNSCRDSVEGDEIKVFATDKDVSPDFGSDSIRYRWSKTTRQPPIELDPKDGTMKMKFEGTAGGFDYERFTEEVYIVEAVDSFENEGAMVETLPVRFKILDKNDVPVDLSFGNGYRASIKENTDDTTDPILTGITATDVDESGKIVVSMTVVDIFLQDNSPTTSNNGSIVPKYKRIALASDDELKEKMQKWFKFEELPGSTDKKREFKIVHGEEKPDREGYGKQEVDRVDLTITAEDLNGETEERQIVSQNVTIIIEDINDNPPEWLDGDNTNFSVSVSETDWDSEGDTATERQREIYTLRVIDRDRSTTFDFSLTTDPEDCKEFEEGICDKILNMFELSSSGGATGTTTLRRKQGQVIDREAREYFIGESDIIKITIVATDGDPDHELLSKFEVTVEDRNDNTPIFSIDSRNKECSVREDASTGVEIFQLDVTDLDHPALFGNVSFLFEDGEGNSGKNDFGLDLQKGVITAIEHYDWHNTINFPNQQYRLQVKAIDYYRSSSTSGSNWNTTYVYIKVDDTNNHKPEFLFETPEVVWDEGNLGSAEELINFPMQDKDDPRLDNGRFSVMIEDILKIPPSNDDLKGLFELKLSEMEDLENKRTLSISTTKSLFGYWGNYTLTLKASNGENSDPKMEPSVVKYFIYVKNGNLNSPEFVYPENDDIQIHISMLDAKPNERLIDVKNPSEPIPNVLAEDADEGSGPNGEVTYWFETQATNPPDCLDLFQIDRTSGMITLRKELDDSHANKKCKLSIKASDGGTDPKSNVRSLEFIVLRSDKNTPPKFAYHPSPSEPITILENSTDAVSSFFDPAHDEDIDNENLYFPDDKIYYFLKGGDSNLFDLIILQEEDELSNIQLQFKPKAGVILDREETDFHRVSIYATNNPEEEVENMDPDKVIELGDTQWAVILVTVLDRNDTEPEFRGTSHEGLVSSGFSVSKKTGDTIGVVQVIDRDCKDTIDLTISSDFDTSHPSLPNNPSTPPFKFEIIPPEETEDPCPGYNATSNIIINFDPQESYQGYYTFQITAKDSANLTSKASCRIYMVASENVLVFYFNNDLEFLIREQTILSEVLTEVFGYKCNVDRVFSNAAYGGVISVETHFINTENDEPVNAEYIKAQQFKPVFYNYLNEKLAAKAFKLKQIGESDAEPESDISQIITYVLIGGVAVLTISMLILSATCYYNKKSLQRRVRALTANTFGSQQSDLNRIGLSTDAPNTNAFAVEGSNPIWTTNADPKRVPDFDAASVGSGGSILIGAEDEDYFKKNSKNPMFQAEDVVANYDSENEMSDHKSYYDTDADAPGDNNNVYNDENASGESPFPSKLTKNPLMNLGEAQMSIDIDGDFDEPNNDESYQFEVNTDAGLF